MKNQELTNLPKIENKFHFFLVIYRENATQNLIFKRLQNTNFRYAKIPG